MSLMRIYLRVLALLGPEKWLATALAVANVGLAAVFLHRALVVRPRGRFPGCERLGRCLVLHSVVDGVGFFGVAANVLVALYSDRLAHRRQLAVIVDFFEHALALPLGFHDRQPHRSTAAHPAHRQRQPVHGVARVLPQSPEHPHRHPGDDSTRATDQLASWRC